MIAFICLFLPAVLCLRLFEYVRKITLTRRQWFYRYCNNVLFINLIIFALRRFVLSKGYDAFGGLLQDLSPVSGMNYLIIAIPVAIAVAFLQIFLVKHAKITLEEKEDA